MKSKQIDTIPGKLSKMSWLVGLLSTSFILSLLYVSEMVSRAYYYARLQGVLNESLTRDSDLLFAADNPEFSQLFVVKQKDIKILKPVISFVAQKQPAAAVAILKRHNLGHSPLNLQLERTLSELETLASTELELKNEVEDNRRMSTEKIAEYTQLKADFFRYLGSETKDRPVISPDAQKEGNNYCTFYAEGLLVDLPVMAHLPDNIADFNELAKYYSLIKPGDSFAPSASVAQKELEVLRDRSAYLQSECGGILGRTEEIEKELAGNEANQKELYTNSRIVLRKILINLAKPQVDEQTVVAYDLFRASAERYGLKLPSLFV